MQWLFIALGVYTHAAIIYSAGSTHMQWLFIVLGVHTCMQRLFIVLAY